MEDVERILDETQESVEYQRVLLKKPKCLEQQNYPFLSGSLGFLRVEMVL